MVRAPGNFNDVGRRRGRNLLRAVRTTARTASSASSSGSRGPHRILGFAGNRGLALAHDGAA